MVAEFCLVCARPNESSVTYKIESDIGVQHFPSKSNGRLSGSYEKDAKIGNPSMNLSNAAFDPNLIEFSSFMRETFLLRGKFISRIKSSAPTTTRAVFLHLLPWQVHVWHSTAQFQCNGQERKAQLRFSPKNSRTAPVLIEMILEIPPKSTCEISYEVQKGFLRFDEYPPDSSSGIHVPGPILNILPGQWSESTIRIHGEPTIVLLPIPDFSMPFNVICFVCTIVALFFQYMLTFTTKYPSTIERESKGLLLWVVHRVKDVYKKFSKKEGNV
ncbi:GPI transamidase component PIG-T [Aphelenchoides besseyi]|nr:GPI transamidase component PIG-T [Aphelenchoides besseyi]